MNQKPIEVLDVAVLWLDVLASDLALFGELNVIRVVYRKPVVRRLVDDDRILSRYVDLSRLGFGVPRFVLDE